MLGNPDVRLVGLSSSDQVAEFVFDIGQHLAVAIAAMRAQPIDYSLNIQLLAFEESRGESKAMITTFGQRFIQMIEKLF